MKRLATELDGVLLIEPVVHGDERGFFQESYRRDAYAELGIEDDWVQDNHSRSRRGVVRGMHFQVGAGQAKLVRCERGAILDVTVDIRRGSPTYASWQAIRLDDEAHHQLYAPIGFAHGFCVLSDVADVVYKVSSYYDPSTERGFAHDDPDVGIEWPDIPLVVSSRDRRAPRRSDLEPELLFVFERAGATAGT